jgi:hypothetical protein
MADIRINSLPSTATSTASDDFFAIDGTTNGTRKMAARTPVFNSVTGNTTTDLTLSGGSSGASLVLGQGASGSATVNRRLVFSADTSGYDKDANISNYSASNGVYLNGNAGGWLQIAGDGTRYSTIRINGGATGAIEFNYANSPVAKLTTNLLIGGTTDITGSGGLKVYGTTAASSSTTGALQIGGATAATGVGIGGGNIYAGSKIVLSAGTDNTTALWWGTELALYRSTNNTLNLQVSGRPNLILEATSNAGASLFLKAYSGAGSRRTWSFQTDVTVASDFALQQSTAEGGSTYTNALYFDASRNATIGGNLTVSGTGTSSFAGKLTATNSPAANTDATAIVGTLGSITGDLNKTYIGVSVGNISGSATDLRQDIRGIDVGTITTSASGQYVGTQGAIVQGIKVGQITGSGTVVPNGYPAYGINVVGISSPGANIGLNVGTITGGTSNISIKTGSGVVSIGDTTDTTGEGSGALQVAGGAFVKKAIYGGTKLVLTDTSGTSAGGIGFGTDTSFYRSAAGILTLDTSGGFQGFEARKNGTLNLAVYNNSANTFISYLSTGTLTIQTTTGTAALTLDTSQNATFAGTVKTVAPTSGTAKAWKLGEAATVSPTSPNRTIRVEIDGTVYYIAAKTTND